MKKLSGKFFIKETLSLFICMAFVTGGIYVPVFAAVPIGVTSISTIAEPSLGHRLLGI
jgi:hypothetical protein